MRRELEEGKMKDGSRTGVIYAIRQREGLFQEALIKKNNM